MARTEYIVWTSNTEAIVTIYNTVYSCLGNWNPIIVRGIKFPKQQLTNRKRLGQLTNQSRVGFSERWALKARE